MRKRRGVLVALVATAALVVPIGTAAAGTAQPDRNTGVARPVAAAAGTGEFVVFYADGVSAADAHAAISAAGGTVLDEIATLGIARVTTDNARFTEALAASGTTKGVVRNHSVGSNTKGAAHRFADERALEDRAAYAALEYTQEGRPASWNATCVGTAAYDSNYGEGIVNAAAAVAP